MKALLCCSDQRKACLMCVRSRRGRTTSLRFGQNLDRYVTVPRKWRVAALSRGCGMSRIAVTIFTKLESLRGKDVTHERCSRCFELNLVRDEFKIMLGETMQ